MQCAAAVSMISFGIQQLLQLLDPFLSYILSFSADTSAPAAANTKKAVMGLLSFCLGLIVVKCVGGNLMVLQCAGFSGHPFLDPAVSALVVGAGTEASNTAQKLLSYTKDKLK